MMNQKLGRMGIFAIFCCGMMGCVGTVVDIAGDVTDAAFDVAEAAVEAPFAIASAGMDSNWPAKVEDHANWTFDAQPIHWIDASTVNGAIVVKGEDRTDIAVLAVKEVRAKREDDAKSFAEKVVIEAKTKRDVLQVTNTYPQPPRDVNVMVRYEIQMPREMHLILKTTNGSVQIEHATGEIQANSTNGAIRITDFLGPIQARTTNGAITLVDGQSEANVETSNGGVKFEQFSGKMDVKTSNAAIHGDIVFLQGNSSLETSNGAIHLTIHKGVSSLYTRTSNGSVTVSLPEDFQGELDARTTNGRIQADYPLNASTSSKKHLAGTLNQGGSAKVTIETSNGGITIKKTEK